MLDGGGPEEEGFSGDAGEWFWESEGCHCDDTVKVLWCKSVDMMNGDEDDEDDSVFDGRYDDSIYTIKS